MRMNAIDPQPASPRPAADAELYLGMACAVSAHVMWGFFPLYWRLFGAISPAILTAHRVAWSFLILAVVVLAVPRLRASLQQLRNPRHLAVSIAAALAIGTNWAAFMFAVTNDQVLQASLGYYINPLLNVLLGVFFLRERLGPYQWLAVGSAALGVAIMTVAGAGVPWFALAMAGSFATYGLLKKKTHLSPLVGMFVETGVLFPIAAVCLFTQQDAAAWANYTPATWSLLVLGGAVTIAPLALFAIAAKRVTLSTIGILQYIGPTLQWFVGAVLLGEPFHGSRLVGFVFVWLGVIVFISGSLISGTRRKKPGTSFRRYSDR
jgi:chloramphenicol-sensitive protein RarD